MSNTNNTNSIAQQLAERRARLQEDSQPHERNQSSSNPPSDKMEEDDFAFATQLQQQFDAEEDNDDNHSIHNNVINVADDSNPELIDSDIEILGDSHSNSSTVIDKDHEIALHLQRQFDNEESNVPQPSHNNHNYNHNHNYNGGFNPFAAQASNSYTSATTPDNNGTVITTRSGPNGQFIQTISTSNNNHNHHPNTHHNQQHDPFNHPFFRQHQMSGFNTAFNSPFFQMQNHHNNNANANPFEAPFFMQNVGMMPNMMNLMMDESLQFSFAPRPQVANQENVDALPTDRYRAKKKKDNIEEEEKSQDIESKKETCSICLEEFKNGEEIRRLPCLHIFHKNEIDRWLLNGADKCPICRVPINGQMQHQ